MILTFIYLKHIFKKEKLESVLLQNSSTENILWHEPWSLISIPITCEFRGFFSKDWILRLLISFFFFFLCGSVKWVSQLPWLPRREVLSVSHHNDIICNEPCSLSLQVWSVNWFLSPGTLSLPGHIPISNQSLCQFFLIFFS